MICLFHGELPLHWTPLTIRMILGNKKLQRFANLEALENTGCVVPRLLEVPLLCAVSDIILMSTLYFCDREISVRRESVKDPSQDTVVLTELSYASLNKVS